MFKNKISAIAFVLLCTLSFYPTGANAVYKIEIIGDAGRNDFVVGPGKQYITLNPGEEKTIEVTVSNRMGEIREFQLETEDFAGSKNADTPSVLLGSESGKYTLKDFIKVESKKFILDNLTRARIPVKISVPFNAEPGGRYASLVVSTSKPGQKPDIDNNVKGSVPIVLREAILFFVTIPGDVKKDGSLIDFKTANNQKYFSSGPVRLQMIFENKGNIHLMPSSSVSVKNMYGQEVYSVIDKEPWFVMPDSLRSREISIFENKFAIGKYTITANVSRGYDNIVDTKELEIWIIPWKEILIAFALLFASVYMFYWLVTRFEFRRKK